jgi:hypothetical protein
MMICGTDAFLIDCGRKEGVPMDGPGRRAVGTRNRVMSHLTTAGEVTDQGGMASAVLAQAVGYPGSSVAFAQLLAAMERSGLIEREIRGKRTYRIAAAPGAPGVVVGRDGRDFDYDELAGRLLTQVLNGAEPASPATADDALTVARLRRKLADVRAGYQRLTEENTRLREQIRRARRG